MVYWVICGTEVYQAAQIFDFIFPHITLDPSVPVRRKLCVREPGSLLDSVIAKLEVIYVLMVHINYEFCVV